MNINIFKQNNKFYFNEEKFYNKKQDLVKAITRELGYPHKEALKYVNNKLGKPTSKKDKEEFYKNKIMMLERRVAYLEDKLNEKEVVSCEVSKPKIEWVKPEPIREPEPIEDNTAKQSTEELKNSQNEYLINMNETKRLLALLEEPKHFNRIHEIIYNYVKKNKGRETDRRMMLTRYNKKGRKIKNVWTNPFSNWCRFIYYKVNDEIENFNKETLNKILTDTEKETDKIIILTKSLETVGEYRYEEDKNTEKEEDDLCCYYFTDEEEEELEIDKEIDLNEIFTDEDTDEEEEEEEKISNNKIDMTQPIINVNKDKLEKITLRDSDTNKFQHFYKYVLREENKEDKIIILTKLLQKVGVCKLWIDKNIDEEFRDEEDCINYEGEELYEIIITVPELCRLDKQLFREFKYTPHYNNLTETKEYFQNWLSNEDFNNLP